MPPSIPKTEFYFVCLFNRRYTVSWPCFGAILFFSGSARQLYHELTFYDSFSRKNTHTGKSSAIKEQFVLFAALFNFNDPLDHYFSALTSAKQLAINFLRLWVVMSTSTGQANKSSPQNI